MKQLTEKYLYKLLIFLLIATNLYKFRLITGGYMTEPDEKRYLMAWSALKHLMQGDIEGFSLAVFSAQGRPAEILVKMIPATLQFISAKIFHLDFFETQNFYIVFLFNFVIYTLTLWLLFKIFQFIFNNKTLSVFGVLSYSLLINSYVYLRHVYPYDTSLLLFLLVLYKIISVYQSKQKYTCKQAFVYGAISFFAFLAYPAYNLSFFALFVIFALLNWTILRENTRQYFKLTANYVMGSIVVLLLFEGFSRLGNTSYIHNALTLSGTVIQGDFFDTPTFLFRYLFEVEMLIGAVIILSLIVFIFKIPKIVRSKKPSDNILIIIVASYFIFYALYVSLGYFAHQFTMYGRILHQFFPVIWLIILYVFSEMRFEMQQKFMPIIAIGATILFVFQMQDYLQIAYPRDVYWTYLRQYKRENITELTEFEDSWSNLPERVFLPLKNYSNERITTINTYYFYPVEDVSKYHPYQIKKDDKLIFDKPHFLNYKPYQFEGYNLKERKNIREFRFRIKIIKKEYHQ